MTQPFRESINIAVPEPLPAVALVEVDLGFEPEGHLDLWVVKEGEGEPWLSPEGTQPDLVWRAGQETGGLVRFDIGGILIKRMQRAERVSILIREGAEALEAWGATISHETEGTSYPVIVGSFITRR